MRRLLTVLIVVLGVVAVTVAFWSTERTPYEETSAARTTPAASGIGAGGGATRPASSSSHAAVSTTSGVPRLAHVFVILMENHSASDITGNSSAPYINGLIRRYAYAADYSAVTHPSLPNYIALTSGALHGITDDRNPPGAGYAVNAVNLADRLQAAGVSWKAYAESLPSAGYANNSGRFATKHEPFLYYRDILGNAARRAAHIVPFGRMTSDLRSAATTPGFAFITPNLYNDMHDGPISAGDSWLAHTVPAILRSPAFTSSPSLLVITWDEGGMFDNHVATIFAGNSVKHGFRSGRPYDHYSLLHTVEAALGLKPMTANDRNAAVMSDLFKR